FRPRYGHFHIAVLVNNSRPEVRLGVSGPLITDRRAGSKGNRLAKELRRQISNDHAQIASYVYHRGNVDGCSRLNYHLSDLAPFAIAADSLILQLYGQLSRTGRNNINPVSIETSELPTNFCPGRGR